MLMEIMAIVQMNVIITIVLKKIKRKIIINPSKIKYQFNKMLLKFSII